MNIYRGSLCRVASRITIVLLALPCMVLGADRSLAPDMTVKVITEKHDEYFASTPQLADPLRPLASLPAGKVTVRAMVATIPDPVETRLGRSFDMALSATLSAFQSQRYVLDGYAFPWKRTIPPTPDAKEEPKKDDSRLYRKMPGVLVFRRETWRGAHGKEKIPADYAVVFLVGESPTYGIQEDAFLIAARCAANFNQPVAVPIDKPCNAVAREEDAKRRQKLDVLGPSFSGSMQSLAIAIQALRGETPRVPVDALVVSASATVSSNSKIEKLMLGSPTDANPIEFYQMAWSLESQYFALRAYLCGLRGRESDVRKVIVLAEESTFGRSAEVQFSGVTYPCTPEEGKGKISIDVRTFPPDIASIRAEHSILRDAAEGGVPGVQKSRGRLLELDMKTAAEAVDRPTIYEPSLSSRSDELMLFRMFDNLRLFAKPNVVVILATDVRDRLFLLSHVRQSLPAALPVMMELDFLAIHPDYRPISRGAVFVPAGDSMVCLRSGRLAPCQWSPQGEKGKNAATAQAGRGPLRTYSFATDYAANVFRTVSVLLRYREPAGAESGSFKTFADNELMGVSSVAPCLYVATLAGFQELRNNGAPVGSLPCRSRVEDGAVPRSSMAVAETRLAAQVPTYVALAVLCAYFMVLAGWVGLDPGQGRVFLSTLHYAVLDGGWLRRLRDRLLAWLHVLGSSLFPRSRSRSRSRSRTRTRNTVPDAATPLSRGVVNRWLCPRSVAFLMLVLFVVAAVTLGLSVCRLYDVVKSGDTALAHGRDGHALFAIWVLYLCICIVAFARLRVAGIRMGTYAHQFVKAISRPDPYRVPTVAFILPVTMTIVVMMVMFRQDIFVMQNIPWWKTPLSVDPAWPWLFAYVVLALGIAFTYNVTRQFRAFSRVTLFISSAGPGIRTWLDEKDWPAPQVLHQAPQTPFNLRLQRTCDMKALSYEAPSIWGRTTCNLVDKAEEMKGGGRLDALRFERWQTQMVAELKLHVVAIRTCVWCAMLAPIAVLMGMSVYPPVFEPRLTLLAIVQLVGTFGYGVYLVLRMEQDAMLGPMYTRNGDQLSIGGSLRALWPKFVAMAVVLLPLVVPDIWRWLLGIVRSINSFT